MTPETLKQALLTRKAEAEALQQQWEALFPNLKLDARQFLIWLELHPLSRMSEAVRVTAQKNLRLNGIMSLDHAVRYCSKVANTAKFNAAGAA